MAANNTTPTFDPNAAYAPAATSAAPAFDPNASYAPADQQTPQPQSTLSKIGDAAYDALLNPQTLKGEAEGAITSMGETIQSLPWVGKKIITPEAMQAEREYFKPGSAAEKYGQTTGDIAEPILEFVLGDEALKGLALSDKVGLASKAAKFAQENPYLGKILQHGVNAAGQGTVGTAEALAKGATLPQALKTGAEVGAGSALLGAASEAAPLLVNPFRRAAGAVSDAASSAVAGPEAAGESVAQPGAQQAIRRGVQAATENAGTAGESLAANIKNLPLIGRNQTVLDEHLSSLRGLEQDAYERMDEAAGFDVKAEKTQLANDQYKIKQLGNTEADITQKENLNASIADSQARIADAEAKMTQAGVDPAEADTLHKQRMAGVDIRKALVNATSSDGETVNLNSFLNASKKLQFNKFGNRLEQFFGSPEAANNFMSGLEDAQKAGQVAMAKRTLRNSLAKWMAAGVGVGGGAYEGVKAIGSALGQ